MEEQESKKARAKPPVLILVERGGLEDYVPSRDFEDETVISLEQYKEPTHHQKTP